MFYLGEDFVGLLGFLVKVFSLVSLVSSLVEVEGSRSSLGVLGEERRGKRR